MARRTGSTVLGEGFTQVTLDAVWNKGVIVAGYDAAKYRKDACGAWIEKAKYGDTTEGGRGWEVDHIKPVAKGGTDELSNLQPLNWKNNRHKSDDFPHWTCAIG